MPTISMFYGIIVSMFFEIQEKHHLPHIHVRYQNFKISIAIDVVNLSRVNYLLVNYTWCKCGLICTEKNCLPIGSLLKKVVSRFVLTH